MLLNVISPHQDDAALSLSLALAELVRCSILVRIINCFTVTNFAPFKSGKTAADHLRTGEDQKFITELGGEIDCIDLGHVDVLLRTGQGLRGIILGKAPTPADELEIRELASHIRPIVKSDALILPLAADLHVDHYLAREAALNLCSSRPWGIYEDLPYTARMRESDIRAKILQLSRRLNTNLHPVLLGRGHSLELKRRCISCYPSQVAERTVQRVLDFSRRYDGAERLWLTGDAMEQLSSAHVALSSTMHAV
jgi:LmbE family N-acetylglucosaminyl deacetylase